jgi:hypothetical protein
MPARKRKKAQIRAQMPKRQRFAAFRGKKGRDLLGIGGKCGAYKKRSAFPFHKPPFCGIL